MKLIYLQFLIVLSLFSSEKEIVVVIPSYNNAQWATYNIKSVIGQNYENFRIIYINDSSSDETDSIVRELVRAIPNRSFQSVNFSEKNGEDLPEKTDRFKKTVKGNSDFFTLVTNTERCGALENIYRAVHSCENHEIIAIVDGDDWLAHDQVLETLNQLYSSNDIWMTHGKLIEYPNGQTFWCKPIPEELIAANSIRQFRCPSHLRTFYCWLFKKISPKDLMLGGKFFPVTGDMAVMFPLTEMAGKHQFFIDEINYVYNVESSLNDNKVATDLQNQFDFYIRHLPPYQPLEKPES